MKKIAVAITFLFLSINLFSQDYGNFLGIKFNQTVPSFVSKLQQKGFTPEPSEDFEHSLVFNGTVANSPAMVFVTWTPISKVVYKVEVFFKPMDNWNSLKRQFLVIEQAARTKFGDPDSREQNFEYPNYDGDGVEFKSIESEKCRYMSIWRRSPTIIVVRIHPIACVSVSYISSMLLILSQKEKSQLVDL